MQQYKMFCAYHIRNMIPSNYNAFGLQNSSRERHREDRGNPEILFDAVS